MIIDVNWNFEKSASHLVVLDRDDTLIRDARGNKSFHPSLINVLLVEKLLTIQTGVYFAIATNQSAIADGLISYTEIINFHNSVILELQKLQLSVIAVAFCPHSIKKKVPDRCLCRKPKGKMLSSLSSLLKISSNNSLFIGNNQTDFEAAQESGFKYLDVAEATKVSALEKWKSQN